MQRDDLSALEIGLRREDGAEEMRCEETEWSAEVVEYEFWVVIGGSAVPG